MQYNRNQIYKSVRTALTMSIASIAALSTASFAQDAGDDETVELERTVTTGSRISRVDIEGASPITVIDREDLDRTGLNDLGDLLREFPSITGGLLGQQSNNPGFTSGSSTTDIRGLGSGRTLFLVNGRRVVDGGDLATIPFAIIERVEILKEGAAAIYGADAVAGVVNVITRTDFSGAELDFSYSKFTKLSDFTDEAGTTFNSRDGEAKRAAFTFGGSSEKGNFIASVEFNDQDRVFAGETPFRALNAPFTFTLDNNGDVVQVQGGSSFTPQGRFSLADQDGDGRRELVTLIPGQDGTSPDDFQTFNFGRDAYNYSPVNFNQRPFERRSVYVQGDYDLFDNVEAYMQTRFINREADRILAPLPFGPVIGDPAFPTESGFLGISKDNAFNPFGEDVADPRRRVVETGGRRFLGEVNQIDIVTGVRGGIGDFAPTWEYDISFNWGKRDSDATQFGQFFGPNLSPALGPSFFDDQGNAVCGTPDAPIGGCVPLNLFGGPGSITQEMLDFVSISANSRTNTNLQMFNATFTGDLIELPAGPLATAFGYESRKQKLDVFNDSGIQQGLVTGNSGGNTSGQFDVDSIFAEVNIPVLSGVPGVELLEFGAGFRYDDFSTIGDTGNFSLNARWQPVRGLLIRGSYSEVFREPSIGELFAAQAEGFPGAADPCLNGDPINAITVVNREGETVQANCPGVPAGGFLQNDTQVRQITGGNANLNPETGETWTVGIAFSPEFLPGFTVTADFWHVDLDGAIATFTAQTILDECAANGALCNLIQRLPDGNIDTLAGNNQNLGIFERQGIDFELSYTTNTNIGLFDARLLGTWLETADVETFEGAGIVDQVGRVDRTVGFNSTGGEPFPEFRLRGDLTWTWGNFDISYVATFLDSMTFTPNNVGFGVPIPDQKVESELYSDVFVGYNAPWGTRVQFGVTNLSNEKPQVVDIGNANTLPELFRLSGRQVTARLRHSF